jgi:4-hydroxybenzoyl-CoA thioesterase/acyl-CoA thioester hydrolase
MAQSYVATRRVEFHDTDAAGIMHFSAFFTFMEEAEHEFLRHLGLGVLAHEASGAVSWPRVAAHCEYQGSVRFEDMVEIDVRIGRVGTKSVTYEFNLSSAGRLIATGQMTSVCCRRAADGVWQSIAIPSDVLEKLNSAAA